jgi:hypothetical protein
MTIQDELVSSHVSCALTVGYSTALTLHICDVFKFCLFEDGKFSITRVGVEILVVDIAPYSDRHWFRLYRVYRSSVHAIASIVVWLEFDCDILFNVELIRIVCPENNES